MVFCWEQILQNLKAQIRKINIFYFILFPVCLSWNGFNNETRDTAGPHFKKRNAVLTYFTWLKPCCKSHHNVHIFLHMNSLPTFQYPFSKIGSFLLLMHQTISMSLDVIIIGLHIPMRKNNGKMYVTSKTIWLSVSGSQGSCHVSIDSYI